MPKSADAQGSHPRDGNRAYFTYKPVLKGYTGRLTLRPAALYILIHSDSSHPTEPIHVETTPFFAGTDPG